MAMRLIWAFNKGVSSLAGVAVLILTTPIQGWITQLFAKTQKKVSCPALQYRCNGGIDRSSALSCLKRLTHASRRPPKHWEPSRPSNLQHGKTSSLSASTNPGCTNLRSSPPDFEFGSFQMSLRKSYRPWSPSSHSQYTLFI